MCGICGFLNYRDDALLKEMNSRLVHRGPDEDGFFTSDSVSLAMRRLKIIDLETGSQPVYNEDESLVTVFNGEIYNFREKREFLISKGHIFKTKTDTEVLVHLYEEFGEGMFAHLRGMFAFALWDLKNRKLILARDHFGIKPLFYSASGGKLFFASEIKALLKSPEVSRETDMEALNAYFTRLYIPSPLTIYKGVKKLPPASFLVWEKGRFEIKKYWKLEKKEEIKSADKNLFERIDWLLEESVKEQRVSDVPLGLFLSGGMDSSSILYYLKKNSGSGVKTFTISHDRRSGYDESKKAAAVAGYFKTQHTVLPVKPNIKTLISKLAAHFDEPFADSSAIVTSLISGEAGKHITVALTGIGGDELFGGYPRYQGFELLKFYSRLPLSLRTSLSGLAEKLPESLDSFNTAGRLKRFLRGGAMSSREVAYLSWISFAGEKEKRELYSSSFFDGIKALPPSDYDFSAENLMSFEFDNYLEGDLLYLADMASMMNSLELRVPFLDLRLVELMNNVPLELKLKSFEKKYILKKILKDKIPAEILKGPKKGFQVPIGRWLKNEIKNFALDIINSSDGVYFNRAHALKIFKDHIEGKGDFSDRIYSLLILELWRKSVNE